jgi:hypothetical protein
MVKYIDKLDLAEIVINQKLSDYFIIRYQKRLNWFLLSEYQQLSEKIIKKFKRKVYWNDISRYQNMSTKFIKKFRYYINWKLILENQTLSDETINEIIAMKRKLGMTPEYLDRRFLSKLTLIMQVLSLVVSHYAIQANGTNSSTDKLIMFSMLIMMVMNILT